MRAKLTFHVHLHTQGMAAELGVEVGTKQGRARLAAMTTSDTESSEPVSDSSDDKSEQDDEVKDEQEEQEDAEGDSPSKGPKRKKIRKAKRIDKVMLQAAQEGRERDAKRQEAQEEAAANLGKKLVLKCPKKDGKTAQEVIVPEHMSKELQPHQRIGVKFIWDTCIVESKGAILAHCMGLGKTFQSITVLQCVWQYHQSIGERPNILVLAPVNVIRNWEAEFDKWLPEPDSGMAPPIFTMVEAGALHADRADYLDEWVEEGGIMLMGYEQFRNLSAGRGIRKGKKTAGIKERYAKALLDPGPYMVVCDEGHILRREKSGVTMAVRRIKTLRRVVLSGTPLQNNLIEYHCMVDFVRPNLLGDVTRFKRDFVSPILNGQCEDSTAADVKQMRHRSHILNSLLKTCVDRADFKILQPYLKPKHEFVIGMRLSALQVKLYEAILKDNVPTMTKDGKGVGKFVGLRVLGTYHKLAKVWTHPKVSVMQREKNYDSMDEFIDDDSEEISWSDEEDRRKKKERKKAKTSKRSGSPDSESDPDVSGEWLKQHKQELEDMAADAMGKMLFLSKLLKEASAIGDKVLLFSQSLLVLDLIEDMLTGSKKNGHGVVNAKGRSRKWQSGVDYFRLDGSTSGDRRQKDIDKFNRCVREHARARTPLHARVLSTLRCTLRCTLRWMCLAMCVFHSTRLPFTSIAFTLSHLQEQEGAALPDIDARRESGSQPRLCQPCCDHGCLVESQLRHPGHIPRLSLRAAERLLYLPPACAWHHGAKDLRAPGDQDGAVLPCGRRGREWPALLLGGARAAV